MFPQFADGTSPTFIRHQVSPVAAVPPARINWRRRKGPRLGVMAAPPAAPPSPINLPGEVEFAMSKLEAWNAEDSQGQDFKIDVSTWGEEDRNRFLEYMEELHKYTLTSDGILTVTWPTVAHEMLATEVSRAFQSEGSDIWEACTPGGSGHIRSRESFAKDPDWSFLGPPETGGGPNEDSESAYRRVTPVIFGEIALSQTLKDVREAVGKAICSTAGLVKMAMIVKIYQGDQGSFKKAHLEVWEMRDRNTAELPEGLQMGVLYGVTRGGEVEEVDEDSELETWKAGKGKVGGQADGASYLGDQQLGAELLFKPSSRRPLIRRFRQFRQMGRSSSFVLTDAKLVRKIKLMPTLGDKPRVDILRRHIFRYYDAGPKSHPSGVPPSGSAGKSAASEDNQPGNEEMDEDELLTATMNSQRKAHTKLLHSATWPKSPVACKRSATPDTGNTWPTTAIGRPKAKISVFQLEERTRPPTY
ncbi:hypothetical protein A0H81_02821 [Grifola frondosa]|uniref:Uncharacterized protein n=1 Tax=Grifola frondosa TaxID=5627 RepID=A0A1C7MJZ0_GRIFR|nr:hypothetical protein A0H81_02821 [Grifola frondosa]